MAADEVVELVGGLHARPVGHGQAQLGEALAHEQLVLREAQRVRTWADGDAGVHEAPEHVLRHVLVVEGHDVDAAREGEHRLGVGVVAHPVGGQRRRHAVGLGEDPQFHPELDRRGNHHPGELPAADHSDPHPCTPSSSPVDTPQGGRLVQSRPRPTT